MDLSGVIDLHVHAGPDVRPRKLDAVALARAAKAAGMRALLLKSHHTITADLAQVVEGVVGGIRVFGGVTLNEPVGGLNPEAVRAAIALGAKEIFMPTHSAANQRRHDGKTGGITILDDAGRLRNEVKPILALVAEADVMLGTCHLSPDEILVLVREARRAGVRKVLVTDLGAAAYDLDPVQGMREFLQQMATQGFSQAEIHLMARQTPARLLALDPW